MHAGCEETIRVVSVMEAAFVTGPAKNLLEFAQRARNAPSGLPAIDLSIITYHRGTDADPQDNPFVAATRKAGLTVGILREKARFDRAVLPQITSLLDQRRPHIIQTHNVKSHFLIRWSGLWRRYRWLAFHHGYTTTDLKMRLYNQLDRWSLQRPAHLVTVCEPFRDQLRGQGVAERRITVQRNAVKPFLPPPPEAVESLRRTLPAGVPVVIMVSRLSHEKGHLDFLRALALLKQQGAQLHAVIVGDGLEREPIERLRQKLGLDDIVSLAGHQNDVRPYYALADFYAMPSHSEGSPNAMLEAMAAGVPIVASNVGGIPEAVTHEETALLVPPHDPERFAAALGRLLREPDTARRLAERASAVAAGFTYEAYHRTLAAIYQRVLTQRAV